MALFHCKLGRSEGRSCQFPRYIMAWTRPIFSGELGGTLDLFFESTLKYYANEIK